MEDSKKRTMNMNAIVIQVIAIFPEIAEIFCSIVLFSTSNYRQLFILYLSVSILVLFKLMAQTNQYIWTIFSPCENNK